MTIAIPVAVLGQLLGIVFRSIIAALTHVADSTIDNGNFKTAYRMHICAGSGLYAIMYFLPIFLRRLCWHRPGSGHRQHGSQSGCPLVLTFRPRS